MRKSNAIDGTTPQQKLFAYAYFNNNGNGTQAAIEAGYSKKTADQQASRLLTKVKVKNLIAKLNYKLENKAIITKEQVIEEYKKIALFDLRTLYNEDNTLKNVTELSDEAGAAITGIEINEMFEWDGEEKKHVGNTVKVKLNGKISALDSIRDTMGWRAPSKMEITPPGKSQTIIKSPDGTIITF